MEANHQRAGNSYSLHRFWSSDRANIHGHNNLGRFSEPDFKHFRDSLLRPPPHPRLPERPGNHLVTTAIYRLYGKGNLWAAILIGYTGAIGIATLSDSIVPYLGESLAVLPGRELHIGFIEEPWLTNPPALLGIAIGYWRPITKFPHFGHVLISTWASLFHIFMAVGESVNWIQLLPIFLFLFIAVWIPCCLSDIIYPLLFVRGARSHNHH